MKNTHTKSKFLIRSCAIILLFIICFIFAACTENNEDFSHMVNAGYQPSTVEIIEEDKYGNVAIKINEERFGYKYNEIPPQMIDSHLISSSEIRNLIKVGEIEKAIQVSDLGLNPSNDGKVIRISIPPLTADRRKELVKQAKGIAENSRTAIRNIRRDGNDEFKKQQKAGELTEDGLKQEEDKLQKLTDKFVAEINKIYESKEKEILEG